MKRYQTGNRIVIHDIPGYDPNTNGNYITIENLKDALDGKIGDKGNVRAASIGEFSGINKMVR